MTRAGFNAVRVYHVPPPWFLDGLGERPGLGVMIDVPWSKHLCFLESEVASKVAVTDADVDAFYKQNLDRFKQADSVHARHILIGVPQNATADARKQARVAAQAVAGQLKRGAPFEDVAKKMSSDTGSAQNGGDLGFFPKGQMTPAFEKAAFALKPGETSGIVETPHGFHIIRARTARCADHAVRG
jgi:peptidyl-prolyl cis-trans isomerase C